jgi:hypothetical protein
LLQEQGAQLLDIDRPDAHAALRRQRSGSASALTYSHAGGHHSDGAKSGVRRGNAAPCHQQVVEALGNQAAVRNFIDGFAGAGEDLLRAFRRVDVDGECAASDTVGKRPTV